MAMPSRLPSLPVHTFLPLSLRPPGSVPPAFLPFFARPAVLPGLPVFVVPLPGLAVVGGHAASLPALSVPVPVAPVAPVAVPLLPLLALHVAQRRAAEAVLHTGLGRLTRPSAVWSDCFLMVVVVVIVGGSAVVVDVLAPVLLVERQLTWPVLVGVVVAVVLRVDHQRPIKVRLHITASFPGIGHLSRGDRVADVVSGPLLKHQIHLKGFGCKSDERNISLLTSSVI